MPEEPDHEASRKPDSADWLPRRAYSCGADIGYFVNHSNGWGQMGAPAVPTQAGGMQHLDGNF